MGARVKRFKRVGMPRGKKLGAARLKQLAMDREELDMLAEKYSKIQKASAEIRDSKGW
eukprot:SAG31_NODE_3852_length_3817_cov_6.007800_2_plen_58_part_00